MPQMIFGYVFRGSVSHVAILHRLCPQMIPLLAFGPNFAGQVEVPQMMQPVPSFGAAAAPTRISPNTGNPPAAPARLPVSDPAARTAAISSSIRLHLPDVGGEATEAAVALKDLPAFLHDPKHGVGRDAQVRHLDLHKLAGREVLDRR